MNLLLLYLITFCFIGSRCVKVRLTVPKLVREGSSPTLTCHYDTEGKPLYSVKWYRGQYEFFQYVPQAQPPLAAFPLGGINIDMSHSNANQVRLINVPTYISGKISCEVSVDETFKTATDSANLTIKDIRIRKPYLNVSSNKLFPLEELKITCSAEETDPPPLINFYVDNVKIDRSMIKNVGNGKAILNSSVLLPFLDVDCEHISPIWLRCDGYVGGFYHLSSASVPIISQLPRDHSSFTDNINIDYWLFIGIVVKHFAL
ncbi:unnamed protein product [Nezara viridula]|uniref:Ig-like domain-containing protein n=1 Tax=Nezara viridula TaxID=85310 RepID=A0A9P0E481_NEZVI|nr:unnamed protein product [Nezara viridula]